MTFFSSLILIVITIIFIQNGYKYFKFKWPENYFGPNDKANIFLSTKPLYYLIFRVMPVLVAIFVIEGTAYKAKFKLYDPLIVGFATGLFYAILNDGKALKDLLMGNINIKIYANNIFQSLLHTVLIFILANTGLLAGYLASLDKLQILLPNIEGLVDNIWAAFFTGVIFYIIYTFSIKPKSITIAQVIESSSKKIKFEIYEYIEDICSKYNADQILVKSVCIAENIERPAWFRQLEYFLSFIKKEGSYGIMQVHSKRPLTDKESIEIAIQKYFLNSQGLSLYDKLNLVKKYNSNGDYINLIEEIIRFISAT